MTQIIIGTTPTITYKYKIVSPSEFRLIMALLVGTVSESAFYKDAIFHGIKT